MLRIMKAGLVAVAAIAAPACGMAQGTFNLPSACTAYATIQKRSCTVSHLFTCANDPAGHQRRVDLDEDGIVYAGIIDAETQWIESHHLIAGRVEQLTPGAADPASFDTLLATGVDTFDFITRDDQGFETRFVGQDRLTGEVVTIDGVALDRTEFEVVASDPATGAEVWRTAGSEFIHRDWRTFVSGTSTVITPDEAYDRDLTPVEFHFPGDPGFLAARPTRDCGALMSLAPILPTFVERL